MVIPCDQHLFLIASAHNDIRHHGIFATIALLSKQYWWPVMGRDIAWYIETCHICQQQSTQQVHCSGPLIPDLLARMGYASKKKMQLL